MPSSQTAKSSSKATRTVVGVLQRAKECGVSCQAAAEMSDRELSKLLFGAESTKPVFKMPDYDYVHGEMAKSGVTLSLLWVEYCNKWREIGEIMEVDWAGQTAIIIDTDTGEDVDTYVFVAALPYSGYAYVEAFLSQNQECWTAAHVNAYSFFGGVTRILVPDNLKTGVIKVTLGETILNKTYHEMAEHYGTAIIPARVKTPKDKATVEGVVGIISTWILAAIRNQRFLSMRELNCAIREKLEVFNNKPFQKKDGSRTIAFQEEKLFLLPLPSRIFEIATWKIATVNFDYHVSVDYQNYSVPYEYIKQKVDIRITKNVVEVMFENNRICSHVRLYGRKNQHSTLDAHMPPDHQKYVQWNGERLKSWSAKIGANTATVVEFFLTSNKVEQQGYKACMALLKLADKYSVERLELACEKALSYTPRPSFKSIQAILKSGQDKLSDGKINPQNPSDSETYGFTRGAKYYNTRGNDKC